MNNHHQPGQLLPFLKRLISRLEHQFRDWDEAQWLIPLFSITGLFFLAMRTPLSGLMLVGILIVGGRRVWEYLHKNYIDLRIRSTFRSVACWTAYHRVYPIYKWVDIYHAARAFASEHTRMQEILSVHDATLQQLMQGYNIRDRRCTPPEFIARKIGPIAEEFLPEDAFWLIQPDDRHSHSGCILRVHMLSYRQGIMLEIATARKDDAIPLFDLLLDRAAQQSIYRNQLISPIFNQEIKAHYHDIELGPPFDLIIHPPSEVTEADIILEPSIQQIIEWTIIDFHVRRAELMRVGLPGRRGILFHGPPGTGKTYTCKYIAHRLANATTILATGPDLAEIKTICQLAKQFQPALVVLEDVDLIFAERTNNPFAPILGEFLEQLDGFRADDQVIFLLTTNAIDRVEVAIKDRPGRISQCIYLGPPSAALRQRYLQTLLRPYQYTEAHVDQIIRRTEGVSQAFLKELIFRTVQFATKRIGTDTLPLVLEEQDFSEAFVQMITGNDRWGKRIVGFHIGS